jgi:hypothetical protein
MIAPPTPKFYLRMPRLIDVPAWDKARRAVYGEKVFSDGEWTRTEGAADRLARQIMKAKGLGYDAKNLGDAQLFVRIWAGYQAMVHLAPTFRIEEFYDPAAPSAQDMGAHPYAGYKFGGMPWDGLYLGRYTFTFEWDGQTWTPQGHNILGAGREMAFWVFPVVTAAEYQGPWLPRGLYRSDYEMPGSIVRHSGSRTDMALGEPRVIHPQAKVWGSLLPFHDGDALTMPGVPTHGPVKFSFQKPAGWPNEDRYRISTKVS